MPKIRVIQATKGALADKMPVAAYCRVSSDSEDQRNSFAAQVKEYTRQIESNEQWALAGIYADKGISGTSAHKRPEFLRLIEDCKQGKVKRILTKSISRFARNTVECLEYVRELKALGVSIYFEKEGLDTGGLSGELMLAIFGSIAQEESTSISGNMRWSYEKRMKAGEFIGTVAPYGYRWKDGSLEIYEPEAEIIRWIFESYLNGVGPTEITSRLKSSMAGQRKWIENHVRYILSNERYAGNSLVQKRYTSQTLPTRRIRNTGEVPQYFVENSHPAIIPIAMYEKAQRLREQRNLNASECAKKTVLHDRFRCAECGSSMKRKVSAAGNVSWVCRKHNRNSKECATLPVAETKVHMAFLLVYRIIKSNLDSILIPMANQLRLLGERAILQNEDINALNAQILKLTDQLHAASKLHSMNFLDTESYYEKANVMNAQLDEVQKKRQQLVKGITKDDGEALEKTERLIETLKAAPDNLSSLEEGDVFSNIAEKVLVNKNKRIIFRLINGLELTGWEGIEDGKE